MAGDIQPIETLGVEQCDNRDVILGLPSLEDNSVDHVITDPPYEDDAHTNQRRLETSQNRADGWNGFRAAPLSFAPIADDHRAFCCAEWKRICRGWVMAFCQAEAVGNWRRAMEAAGITWKRAAIWIKPNGQPQYTGDRPGMGYESIAIGWAGEGKSTWNGGGKHGIYRCPKRARNGRHQTEKPLSLMEAIIRDFTQPGELICDPFAGVGTTLVAAKRLGRRWIGMELDATYCAIARERLAEAREQMRLFGG